MKDLLLTLAMIAQTKSYSPYSDFPVGAAILARNPADGSLQYFVGTNIENASYGLTVCAERVAIFTAITAGYTELLEMVCVANSETGTSCGACRQVEYEFGAYMKIHFANSDGEIHLTTSPGLLLPKAFGPKDLD